jgi:hypothetical protein
MMTDEKDKGALDTPFRLRGSWKNVTESQRFDALNVKSVDDLISVRRTTTQHQSLDFNFTSFYVENRIIDIETLFFMNEKGGERKNLAAFPHYYKRINALNKKLDEKSDWIKERFKIGKNEDMPDALREYLNFRLDYLYELEEEKDRMNGIPKGKK